MLKTTREQRTKIMVAIVTVIVVLSMFSCVSVKSTYCYDKDVRPYPKKFNK